MHDRYETSSRDDCDCRRHFVCGACLFGPRPAVRVDEVVIFPDGTSLRLTADELRCMGAGKEVLVDPRSGRRTPLVGNFDDCPDDCVGIVGGSGCDCAL